MTPGNLDIERHPHDLVVDERPLGPQPVGAAHVAVVGGEDDDGVVPLARGLEGPEHGAQAAIGQLVEVDVVVEMAEPGRLVPRVDVAPQTVLLVPTPLSMGLRLGVQVIVEVGRELVDHLGIGLGEDGQGVVVLPGGRLEHLTDGGHVVGMAFPIAGLVHRKPHDVVRVDQGHGQEPGLGGTCRRGVLLQPVGRVGGDDRVEVHPGAGPTHEVAVVAVPVGEAVGLHVGRGRVGQVPLADVGRAVAGPVDQ